MRFGTAAAVFLCTAGMEVWADTLPHAQSVPPQTAPDLVAPSETGTDENGVSAGGVTAGSSLLVPSLDSRQRGVIRVALARKRQAVIAGGALLALGMLIDYALVMPVSADLERTDLGGQLALVSPQILAFGLRAAGPSMAAMRTSEIKDVWKRNTGRDGPRSLAWTLGFFGWGFYAASVACGMVGIVDSMSGIGWSGWSLAMGITADVVWAGTVAYAWWYLARIGHAVDAGPPPASAKVSAVPAVSRRGAPGLAIVVRF